MSLQESQRNPKLLLTLSVLLNHRILPQSRWSSQLKSALSDHDMTAFVRKLNSLKFKPRTIKCRKYSKCCAARFNDDLSSVSWENLSECQDVNNAWLNFKTSFMHVADNHTPQIEKKVRGRNTPWLSNKIKKVMAERDHYYRQARRTNTELHQSRNKSLRNEVTAMIRRAKSSSFQLQWQNHRRKF